MIKYLLVGKPPPVSLCLPARLPSCYCHLHSSVGRGPEQQVMVLVLVRPLVQLSMASRLWSGRAV